MSNSVHCFDDHLKNACCSLPLLPTDTFCHWLTIDRLCCYQNLESIDVFLFGNVFWRLCILRTSLYIARYFCLCVFLFVLQHAIYDEYRKGLSADCFRIGSFRRAFSRRPLLHCASAFLGVSNSTFRSHPKRERLDVGIVQWHLFFYFLFPFYLSFSIWLIQLFKGKLIHFELWWFFLLIHS